MHRHDPCASNDSARPAPRRPWGSALARGLAPAPERTGSVEIHGFVARDGQGHLCFFATSGSPGVPLPELGRPGYVDRAEALLHAVIAAPTRTKTRQQIEALDPEREGAPASGAGNRHRTLP